MRDVLSSSSARMTARHRKTLEGVTCVIYQTLMQFLDLFNSIFVGFYDVLVAA